MGTTKKGDGLKVLIAIRGLPIESGLVIEIDSNLRELRKDADRVIRAFVGTGRTKGKS